MAAIDDAQIRAAVSMAKDSRRKYSPTRLENISERARISAERRFSGEKFLSSSFAPADVSAAKEICAQTRTEIRRFLQKQKSSMIKCSSLTRNTLRSGIESQRKAREYLASLKREASPPGLNFNFVILDTPLFILPTQGIILDSTHVEPWNNVAKVSGEWETPYPDNRTDSISFVFVWTNPSSAYAVVNVESYLMLNGFCHAWADGGFWAANDIYLGIWVSLGIFEWWNNPPTYPPTQTGQEQSAVSLNAIQDGLFEVGDYESSGINGYYDVRYEQFVLPPDGTAVFEVNLAVGHFIDGGGNAAVDLASGDFEVMCPAVVIGILS
jgi:hypothetical protein